MPLAVMFGQQQRGRALMLRQLGQQLVRAHLADVARAETARQFELLLRLACAGPQHDLDAWRQLARLRARLDARQVVSVVAQPLRALAAHHRTFVRRESLPATDLAMPCCESRLLVRMAERPEGRATELGYAPCVAPAGIFPRCRRRFSRRRIVPKIVPNMCPSLSLS